MSFENTIHEECPAAREVDFDNLGLCCKSGGFASDSRRRLLGEESFLERNGWLASWQLFIYVAGAVGRALSTTWHLEIAVSMRFSKDGQDGVLHLQHRADRRVFYKHCVANRTCRTRHLSTGKVASILIRSCRRFSFVLDSNDLNCVLTVGMLTAADSAYASTVAPLANA